jgi:hypothetical protein
VGILIQSTSYGWQVYSKVYTGMSIYQYIPVYTGPFLRLDLSPIGLLSLANHDFWREKTSNFFCGADVVAAVVVTVWFLLFVSAAVSQSYVLRIRLLDYILASVQA